MKAICMSCVFVVGLLIVGCGVDNYVEVEIDGRDDFIGTWKGTYAESVDTLVIEKSHQDNELLIELHTSFQNPPIVVGQVISPGYAKVVEQKISGSLGSIELQLNNGQLDLKQTGLGVTLTGTYRRVGGTDKTVGELDQVEYYVPLPTDKPRDIPVYPNGSVTMVFGKDVKTIRMESDDKTVEIMNWFESQVGFLGWEVVNAAEKSLMAKKPDRSLVVSFLEQRDPSPDQTTEFVIQYR